MDNNGIDTPFDADATREHLLNTAVTYAESFKSRSGLAGIMLYGSLVRGSITPFSDVDMVLLYASEPPHRIEHRMAGRTKLDLISFTLEEMKALLDPIPRSLDVGFPLLYVLESFLLAKDDSILHDPTGELSRVKTRLGEGTSFQALNRVSVSEGYHLFYRPAIAEVTSMLEQGDNTGALKKAKWAGQALTYLARSYTVLKDTRNAAEQLGIPGFSDKYEEIPSIMSSDQAAEAILAATRALWDYTMRTTHEPLRERLREQGIAEPDLLELDGDYDLFWPGDNLNELGRVLEEVNLSLRWCRYELDRGKGSDALDYLWSCRGMRGIRHKWTRLSAALKDTGYDCSTLIKETLRRAGFAGLGKSLDSAIKAADNIRVTPETVQQALLIVDEMERMLTQVIPFMSEAELAEWKGRTDI